MTDEEVWLRDFAAFKASLRNYATWFPDLGAVSPTDLDCVLHAACKGADHLLVLEFKGPGGRLGRGQAILQAGLRRLGTHDGVKYIEVVTVGEHRMVDLMREPTLHLSGDWTGTVTISQFRTKVEEWWYEKKKGG